MNPKEYVFDAVILAVPEIDGAYIEFPYDVRAKIGKAPGDTVRVTIVER